MRVFLPRTLHLNSVVFETNSVFVKLCAGVLLKKYMQMLQIPNSSYYSSINKNLFKNKPIALLFMFNYLRAA